MSLHTGISHTRAPAPVSSTATFTLLQLHACTSHVHVLQKVWVGCVPLPGYVASCLQYTVHTKQPGVTTL